MTRLTLDLKRCESTSCSEKVSVKYLITKDSQIRILWDTKGHARQLEGQRGGWAVAGAE